MSSELKIKQLQGRITQLNNVLNESIENKVANLTTQINELTLLLNEVKTGSHYKYAVTAECEGIAQTGQLLNLSYGGGAPNENNFGLYISNACTIHHMTFMSVFGQNEIINPQIQLTIQVMRFPQNELFTSYSFPNSGYHTGFTSEDVTLDIPEGCMLYVYSNFSNLTDVSNRHRLSFEFKTNLF